MRLTHSASACTHSKGIARVRIAAPAGLVLAAVFTAGISSGMGRAPSPRSSAPGTSAAAQKPETKTGFSTKVGVTLDVGVLAKDGAFIPGLKKEYFRVLEDGVPQTITTFSQTKEPITAVMLVEFANDQYFYNFQIDSIKSSYVFTQSLKKEDWVAMMSYDIKLHVLEDFTQDKRAILGALAALQPGMASSSERNLFDALYETVDRLQRVEGRKYIILISSGRDTLSKKTLDQILKKIQGTNDMAIYTVSTGQALRDYAETHGLVRYLCGDTSLNCNMEFIQADKQLKSFAKMTGGRYYQPLFPAQFREALSDMSEAIRNQYSISYHPTNRVEDGSFRKIKVELVDEMGQPLRMKDQRGKDIQYQVITREGYKSKMGVE